MCRMTAQTTDATRNAVSVSGLRKTYGKKVVLDGVDLSIGEGEVFALLGPNGAGKTTIVQSWRHDCRVLAEGAVDDHFFQRALEPGQLLVVQLRHEQLGNFA